MESSSAHVRDSTPSEIQKSVSLIKFKKRVGIPLQKWEKGASLFDSNKEEVMVRMLGKYPDPHIAKAVGCATSTVHRKRKALGIGPFSRGRVSVCDWSKVDFSKSNREIAISTGCSIGTVEINRRKTKGKSAKNRIDWKKVSLGKDFDTEIAKELGVSAAVVGQRRKMMCIDRYRPNSGKKR